ncbi:unnamed protein product [Amoebophrya sp. A120]|nr:unnamed protein product [Amoebophrya sp. A120]|eukprot:GSA120T00010820001.1
MIHEKKLNNLSIVLLGFFVLQTYLHQPQDRSCKSAIAEATADIDLPEVRTRTPARVSTQSSTRSCVREIYAFTRPKLIFRCNSCFILLSFNSAYYILLQR